MNGVAIEYIKKGKNDALLDVEPILKFFSNNKKQAIERYVSFIEEKDIKIKVMKDSEFSEGIKILETEKSNENKKISLEEIIQKTCNVLEIDEKELRKKQRTKRLVECR